VDFRTRFPLRLGRPSVDDEVDAELEFHLAMRRRELMAQGMTAAQARQAALEKFGGDALPETIRNAHAYLNTYRQR